MISLTRLNGLGFTLNSDLIERIEATPDTVVHLSDGVHYLVEESVDEVVAACVAFRSEVLARAAIVRSSLDAAPDLQVLPGGDHESTEA